mmetsp:Transcript_52935/g.172240  ORF Transcript_52935/g.172240 Transcript_52935/m.172240 type:complete len:206 (-) Transcript_52935:891-1508(-)
MVISPYRPVPWQMRSFCPTQMEAGAKSRQKNAALDTAHIVRSMSPKRCAAHLAVAEIPTLRRTSSLALQMSLHQLANDRGGGHGLLRNDDERRRVLFETQRQVQGSLQSTTCRSTTLHNDIHCRTPRSSVLDKSVLQLNVILNLCTELLCKCIATVRVDRVGSNAELPLQFSKMPQGCRGSRRPTVIRAVRNQRDHQHHSRLGLP